MNLALWLERAARRWPDAPALLRGETVLATYDQWQQQVGALAGHLRDDAGLKPGDRAAIFLPNAPEYLTILYACWQIGAAVVPVNFKLHPRELAWIVGDAKASILFTDAAHHAEAAAALAEAGLAVPILDPATLHAIANVATHPAPSNPVAAQPRLAEDLAWLFYTSGTTGRPKGVMITHGNLAAMALTYLADVDAVTSGDAALYAAPMSHGAGIYNFMHVLRGARHVVPESGGFDPAEIIALAPRLGQAHLFAAPTMVTRLLQTAQAADYRGEGIRTIVYGGGPMYLADIAAALDWFGPRFVQIYGQGECPMAITALGRDDLADRAHPRWPERAASVGLPQSCVEVMIADAAGQPVPAGQTGEVLVRGAPVMPGYWRNPAASENALRGGWLWTGDMGAFDPDGYLTLKDRSKDVIISGGTNIYPREVEEALLLHPAVSEVSVIGEPDPDWGENVAACIVLRDDCVTHAGALDAHCRDHIARFKRPKRYIFLPQLPKNNYGKVLKTELRALIAAI